MSSFVNIVEAGPMADAPPISDLFTNVANVLLGVSGTVAVLVIVVAGIMYITSGGDENRVRFAKKALLGGMIGLVVILLALVIVNTIVRLV